MTFLSFVAIRALDLVEEAVLYNLYFHWKEWLAESDKRVEKSLTIDFECFLGFTIKFFEVVQPLPNSN